MSGSKGESGEDIERFQVSYLDTTRSLKWGIGRRERVVQLQTRAGKISL
jgi:hypothetical protein